MSKVIDIKTKKEVKFLDIPYKNRHLECKELNKSSDKCSCEYCKVKSHLSDKLLMISKWLVLDYCMKNNIKLYNGDWLDIVNKTAAEVRLAILNSNNTKN